MVVDRKTPVLVAVNDQVVRTYITEDRTVNVHHALNGCTHNSHCVVVPFDGPRAHKGLP